MTAPVAPTTLLAGLRWRYATKRFDPAREIPPDVWSALEESLVLAPSSFGLQPWRFVVVTDAGVKERLVACSWNQAQPRDCSHHVVFAVAKDLPLAHVDRFLARTAELRGVAVESLGGFRKMLVGSLDKARTAGTLDTWQTHQVYIALGQFMASAALVGVDACPMEGIDCARYDEILGLVGSGYATVVACAAGYRASDDKYAAMPKVRFRTEDVVVRI